MNVFKTCGTTCTLECKIEFNVSPGNEPLGAHGRAKPTAVMGETDSTVVTNITQKVPFRNPVVTT